jgi:hypothetical protein
MSYRSNAEQEFASALTDKGLQFQYEEFKLPYVISKHYNPDFFLIDYGFFIEYKGYFKPADRKKHLLIKQQHPHIDLRFIFQNASNKLNKRSRTTYGDWCDRHQFLWAEGSIPKQWIRKKKKIKG